MSQLEVLKLQLGINDSNQDGLLQVMLDDVKTDLLTWTNRIELPMSLEPTQRQIVIIRYNKQGIEGQTSHSEGGISRAFEDLPPSLQKTINEKRLLKAVRLGAAKTT